MVIQYKLYLLCMLSGPEKKVRRIVFIFSTKFKMAVDSHATPICSKEATYPGHMLIRFWCDSDITFSGGLNKNLETVLYFSIIKYYLGLVETQALSLRQI